MHSNDTRSKLKNIINGIIIEGTTDNCTAIRNILCGRFSTSTTVKKDFESKAIAKKEQAEFLKKYARETGFWIKHAPDESQYLARGGESKVYFEAETKSVIKLNDGIYYATWLEFFNSIVIHNLLFQIQPTFFWDLLKLKIFCRLCCVSRLLHLMMRLICLMWKNCWLIMVSKID